MWVKVLYWMDGVWSSTEWVFCACDPSVHPSVPSICFVCMSGVISSFMSLRDGSQVFALLMLFLWVILHSMWLGKSLKLLCILVCCACLPSV